MVNLLTFLSRSTHLLPGRKDGRRVYGGQVVGQALMAANNTIPSQFHPHSIHCQFVAPGDISRPIIYDVTRVRDGRSFCSRLVKALQNGVIIFTMIISFHISEPDSISHQAPIPDLPPPLGVRGSQRLFSEVLLKALPCLQKVYPIDSLGFWITLKPFLPKAFWQWTSIERFWISRIFLKLK